MTSSLEQTNGLYISEKQFIIRLSICSRHSPVVVVVGVVVAVGGGGVGGEGRGGGEEEEEE